METLDNRERGYAVSFRPTCPRCGNLCEPEATICDCGSRTGIAPRVVIRPPFDANAANAASLVPAVPTCSRFIVTEIEGFLSHGGQGVIGKTHVPGLSCHVSDRAVSHRIVATFRTEDVPKNAMSDETGGRLSQWERRERVRGLARARAMELNAQ